MLRICITLTRIKTGTLLDVRYAGSFSLQRRANGWPTPAKIRGFLSRCQLDSWLNKKGHSKQASFKTEGAPSTKLEIILWLPNSTMIEQNLSWNSNMSGKQGPSHGALSGGRHASAGTLRGWAATRSHLVKLPGRIWNNSHSHQPDAQRWSVGSYFPKKIYQLDFGRFSEHESFQAVP